MPPLPPQEDSPLYEACVELRARLEHTEVEIGKLSSLLAHDLRARLRAIDADRDLLSELLGDPTEGEGAEAIERLSGSIKRIDGLLQSCLLVLREARHPPSLSTFPLESALAMALDQLRRRRPEAVVEDPPLSSAIIRADGHRLTQVLDALLDNAVKHGAPPCSIELTPGDDWVKITICDRGQGVPVEAREKAMRMGVRLTHTPGHGLGLYIASRLMEGWGRGPFFEEGPGGRISVEVPLDSA